MDKKQIRVMVSTNAFGMGIDKPNVRTVVHMDMPESPEAYFQEAGRAGRDEEKAYAVLLFNLSDKMNAIQQLENTMPSIFEIKNVYNALGNFFQLAIGSGMEKNHAFEIIKFCKQYNFQAVKTYNALKFLEQEELLFVSEGVYQNSKLMFKAQKDVLYKFMVENKRLEPILKFLLRSYGGVFDGLFSIKEEVIAQKLKTTKPIIIKALTYLDQVGIIQYEKFTDTAFIKYLEPRLPTIDLNLNQKQIEFRISVFKNKLNSMIHYATNKNSCRSNELLAYFGEVRADRCGVCDFCVGRNKLDISDLEYENFIALVRNEMKDEAHTVEFLVGAIPYKNKDKLLHFLKWIIDYEILIKQENDKYIWNEKALH